MDHDALRQTYQQLNERACVYEKALLSGLCNCRLAERFNLAEREGIHCHLDSAQQRCERLLELLRERARFALKLTHEHDILLHSKAMRLQIGGLRGLYRVIENAPEIPILIGDVNHLVEQAEERYNGLENLPFQELIKEIAAYKGRQRLR